MALVPEQPANAAQFTIEHVAENALLLSWQQQISVTQHNKIIALQTLLNAQLAELIVESVASYHCLMIYYPFQLISADVLSKKIISVATAQQTDDKSITETQNRQASIRIPVYYDIEQQWDLHDVAKQCKLTIDEVIKQHSSTTYRSYALGFTPGFCYLASLPKALTMARKSSPRTKVPKGAVAIAEQQTAIYPNESPGGWHIIGQTPLAMYQCKHGEFIPKISVGQKMQFDASSKQEVLAMQRACDHD